MNTLVSGIWIAAIQLRSFTCAWCFTIRRYDLVAVQYKMVAALRRASYKSSDSLILAPRGVFVQLIHFS